MVVQQDNELRNTIPAALLHPEECDSCSILNILIKVVLWIYDNKQEFIRKARAEAFFKRNGNILSE
jgi:hypothetical protein